MRSGKGVDLTESMEERRMPIPRHSNTTNVNEETKFTIILLSFTMTVCFVTFFVEMPSQMFLFYSVLFFVYCGSVFVNLFYPQSFYSFSSVHEAVAMSLGPVSVTVFQFFTIEWIFYYVHRRTKKERKKNIRRKVNKK